MKSNFFSFSRLFYLDRFLYSFFFVPGKFSSQNLWLFKDKCFLGWKRGTKMRNGGKKGFVFMEEEIFARNKRESGQVKAKAWARTTSLSGSVLREISYKGRLDERGSLSSDDVARGYTNEKLPRTKGMKMKERERENRKKERKINFFSPWQINFNFLKSFLIRKSLFILEAAAASAIVTIPTTLCSADIM